MILPKEIWGIHLISWFPGVVTFRVAPPLYEVLEHSGASMELVISDLLHFLLFFIIDQISIDQIRWGMGVIWTMGKCFDVWGKKGHVEDQMYCP